MPSLRSQGISKEPERPSDVGLPVFPFMSTREFLVDMRDACLGQVLMQFPISC